MDKIEIPVNIRFVSSMEKVFPVPDLPAKEIAAGQALRGEIYSFQIAACLGNEDGNLRMSVSVDGPLAKLITIRSVRNMPSDYPTSNRGDHDLYNNGMPGLYPDLLYPLENGHMFKVISGGWTALWVTVRIPEDQKPGKFEIPFHLVSFEGNPPEKKDYFDRVVTYKLEILPQVLPEQKLKHLEWFHADCIYKKYNVKPWGKKYWILLEKYIASAADHGINMMYTPLWTPPLDTAVGTERPTIQLLEIEKKGKDFVFDFSRLKRYIELAKKCGMKYFEISHPFTQWGAKCTPKIIIKVKGHEKKYFGWHVPANSPEYARFLKQLMKGLLPVLREEGLSGKCWFTVSDEPQADHLASYGYASKLMSKLIEEFPTLDALSHTEFYDQGLVQNPVPCTSCVEAFRSKVKELWTYYCCGGFKVSNRFFAMTGGRTRVIGIQLWLYRVVGFLQWGFNFWYSQFSLDTDIDVFSNTDANRSFPSGDAFLVYPGPDGPLDSIRGELIREAMQDMRLLDLAAEKLGRSAVEKMVQKGIQEPITMMEYPCSAEWILDLRKRLLAAL